MDVDDDEGEIHRGPLPINVPLVNVLDAPARDLIFARTGVVVSSRERGRTGHKDLYAVGPGPQIRGAIAAARAHIGGIDNLTLEATSLPWGEQQRMHQNRLAATNDRLQRLFRHMSPISGDRSIKKHASDIKPKLNDS